MQSTPIVVTSLSRLHLSHYTALTVPTCTHLLSALMSYRMGDFQESFRLATAALKLNPNHVESRELQTLLQKTFLNT